MTTGPFYQAEDLERAWKLKSLGLSWRVVGTRMGRPHDSLKKCAHRYRRGTWAPHGLAARLAEKDRRAEELVAAGVTKAADIAREIGLGERGACRRLLMLGLDAEMRRAAAQHSCP